MPKPRALDLFCGAGGATKGLQLAGFHVTGVDIAPQPRYCGDVLHQVDAMTFPLKGRRTRTHHRRSRLNRNQQARERISPNRLGRFTGQFFTRISGMRCSESSRSLARSRA